MTVGDWLHSRSPRPPAALVARIDSVLGDQLGRPIAGGPELFLAAGESLVAELLRNNNTNRESALDLLAADALVTYAFEAASGDAQSIDLRASEAMERIAALAGA